MTEGCSLSGVINPNRKWGYEHAYGHNVLPTPWHKTGFTLYDPEPLRIKNSFHEADLPVYREKTTTNASYEEREQDPKFNMSAYGCHRDMHWGDSLRSPRNPFPGLPNREQRYRQEPSPSKKWRTKESLKLTAKSIAIVNPSGSRKGTPLKSEHVKQLKTWLEEWQETSAQCRKEHARAAAGLPTDLEL